MIYIPIKRKKKKKIEESRLNKFHKRKQIFFFFIFRNILNSTKNQKMTETSETPAQAQDAEQKTASPESTPAGDAAPAAIAEEAGTNGDSTPAETNGEEKPVAEEEKQDPPKEMRAIVLTVFGGMKGVKVLKKPEPTVQAGEVLIRVKAW